MGVTFSIRDYDQNIKYDCGYTVCFAPIKHFFQENPRINCDDLVLSYKLRTNLEDLNFILDLLPKLISFHYVLGVDSEKRIVYLPLKVPHLITFFILNVIRLVDQNEFKVYDKKGSLREKYIEYVKDYPSRQAFLLAANSPLYIGFGHNIFRVFHINSVDKFETWEEGVSSIQLKGNYLNTSNLQATCINSNKPITNCDSWKEVLKERLTKLT